MSKLTIKYLQKEICKRDDAKGTGYDLRANHVSACIKHLEDIIAENLADYEEGEDIGTPFLLQFKDRIIKKMRKIRQSRIPDPKRTVTRYTKSKRPDKKGR